VGEDEDGEVEDLLGGMTLVWAQSSIPGHGIFPANHKPSSSLSVIMPNTTVKLLAK
jgi:hypothetical protein